MAFKGDLKNVQLADLFQTLSQNQQEGVLTIACEQGTRRVQFTTKGISLLDPQVAKRRRLGEILISSGLIGESDLADALREQTRTHRFLGETLVDAGKLTSDELQRLLQVQVEEELYDLFQVENGVFEFREEQLQGNSLPQVAPFHVDAIVLEAARRLDEWRLIKRQIPDLERVYVAGSLPAGTTLDEDAEVVLQQLDGKRTVRDTADSLLSSPFAVAKVLAGLLVDGCVRPASKEEILHAAQDCLASRNVHRSRKLLHCLKEMDAAEGEYLPELAHLFREAGDHKASAQAHLRLARLARDDENFEEARRQLEEARKDQPDSVAVLTRLAEIARDTGDTDGELRYLKEVAEAQEHQSDPEGVIRSLERVLLLAPDDVEMRRKLVDQCLRARLKEKAIEILEQHVQILKKTQQNAELALAYKRILGIDPGRTDVKRALVKIRRGRAERLFRAAMLGLVVASVALAAGWYILRAHQISMAQGEIQEARDLVASRDLVAARAKLQHTLDAYPFSDIVGEASALLEHVDSSLADSIRSERLEAEQILDQKLAAVQQKLDEKQFDAALAALVRIFEESPEPYLSSRIVLRLRAATQALASHVAEVKAVVGTYRPPRLDSEIYQAYYTLTRTFPEDTPRMLSALRKTANAGLESAGPEARVFLEKVLEITESWRLSHDGILPELGTLTDRYLRLQTLDRLSGDFLSASRAAEAGDFELSLQLYDNVLADYGDGDLLGVLERRQKSVRDVLDLKKTVEALLQEEEVEEANRLVRDAVARYADLPVTSAVPLPIRLESTPPGARVLRDGKPLGQTPLILRLGSKDEQVLDLELEGFETHHLELEAGSEATQVVEMSKELLFDTRLDGAFASAPVSHAGMFFVASRDGLLYRIDPVSTNPVASFRTGSLAGSRSSPLSTPLGVVVAVVEGKVWLVDVNEPAMRAAWHAELSGEIHFRPVLHENLVLVATQDGSLVALDLATGKTRWQFALQERRLVADPTVHQGRLLLALTGGEFASLDLATQSLIFVTPLGEDLFGSPAVQEPWALASTVTGVVIAMNLTSGQVEWSVAANDLPKGSLRATRSTGLLPLGDRVVCIDWKEHDITSTWGPGLPVAGTPAVDERFLYLGGTDGFVYVFAPGSARHEYRIRVSTGAVLGSPALAEGQLAALGSDGTFRVFRR